MSPNQSPAQTPVQPPAPRPRQPEPEGSALLHNMSTPPKTVVTYAGLGELARAAQQRNPSRAPAQISYSGVFGMALRFELPRALRGQPPEAILKILEIAPQGEASRQLAALINARANTLSLPDGCVVVAERPDARVLWDDPISVLAVLAKASASVWLRSKTPALHAAVQRQQVTLLVPPMFAKTLV